MAENISVTLTLDDSVYTAKLEKAGKSAEDFGKKVQKAGNDGGDGFSKLGNHADTLRSKFEALGTVLLGVGFVAMTQKALEFSDSISDLSDGTGIAIDRILQLREAFAANGGSAEGLGKIISKLTIYLYDAQDGAAGAQESLLKLGLSFSDMANMNTDQAMQAIIDKLAGMTDHTEQQALAFKVFGKEARNINWEGIRDGTASSSEEFRKYAESIKKAGEVHDKLAQAQERMIIVFTNMLSKLGVLDALDGMNTSFEKTEQVVLAATTAFGVMLGLGIFKWIVELRVAMLAYAAATTATTVATEGLTAANVALAATPMGRIAAIVAALAGLAAAYFGVTGAIEAMDAAKAKDEAAKKPFSPSLAGVTGGEWGGDKKPDVNPAWQKEITALDQISEAYKRTNNEMIKKIQLENEQVGASQESIKLSNALAEADRTYAKQIADLNDKIAQESVSTGGDAARAAKLGQLEKEKIQITELYNEYKRKAEVEIKGLNDSLTLLRQKSDEYDQQVAFEKRLQKATDDVNKLGLGERERKLYDISSAARDAADAQINKEEKLLGYQRNNITGELVKIKLSEDRKNAIIKSYNEQAVKEQENASSNEEYARRFETGWANAYAAYADSATNAAKAAENIFNKTMSGMEDLIVGFAKTGKLEWKNFVASMAEELLRSNIKQLLASTFAGASSGGSSFLGSVGSLLGFADGGTVPTNGPVLVGERGPELLSGIAGRTVIPNNQINNMGGTQVTYNINAVDTNSFKSLLASDPSFLYALTMQGAKGVPARR